MRNPYISGPPIHDPENFYGRREAVGRIFAMLSGPQLQSLMLLGLRRAGKTSLMNIVTHPRAIATLLPRADDHILAYVNLEADVRTPADFYRLLTRRILESVRPSPMLTAATSALAQHALDDCKLGAVERLLEMLNRKTTILLDEFETLTSNRAFSTEFFNGLRSLVARYPLAWITASYRNLYQLGSAANVESSPFFNVFNQAIFVGAMSSEEVRELVLKPAQRAGRPFTPGDADWIEQVAGGLPCYVQKLAELLFDARRQCGGNEPAARESAARAFSQWVIYHYHHYWKHFTDEEQEALSLVASRRPIDWTAYRVQHGTEALDALIAYGLIAETDRGYQIRSQALELWIMTQTRPLRTLDALTAAYGARPSTRNGNGGSRMLEAAQVSLLARAIDFIFEQGRLILDERRQRRTAALARPNGSSEQAIDPDAAPDNPPLDGQMTKGEALRAPIRMTTWSLREAEVRHLVSLLEIQTNNYWQAKEQYARWGSALVPPVIVSNLEEAENAVAETTARLNSIMRELYGQPVAARPT